MTAPVPPRRLLFVHAHPDDETLTTGLTMAHYVAAGHEVHVLTCTLGEEGEVIPPELRHLAADREDRLGPWRREELRRAMDRLGVAHSVLGEDPATGVLSRYRDSGMAGTPSAAHPDAFAGAAVADAAELVAAHLGALAPDVVVTYEQHGGYGHPDHIQAHRVTMAAVASLEPARQPLVYSIVTPRSWAREDRLWLAGHVDPTIDPALEVPAADAPWPPSVVPDALATHVVEAPELVAVQSAALAEHATQVRVFEGYYALSNDIAARLAGREAFVRVDPATGLPVTDTAGGAARHTGLLPEEGDL